MGGRSIREGNAVQEKSYRFALRIVRMYQHLSDEKREFILSKQALRSGTSIGANVEEALGGASRRDFAAKLNIAYKEARETDYWLRLLKDAGYLDEDAFRSVESDCTELRRLLYSIIKSTRTSSE
ncbi:MAG TPA: four helix bundle protein [Rhodothermales bacterium]|nr:four helix bundle protein [Rhodothermales bacterium]